MKTKKIGKWVSFTLLILLILVFLFPYYVMITGAFKSQMALQLIPPDLNPFRNLTGKNAAYVWQKTEILLWLANSTAVSYTHLDVYKRQMRGRLLKPVPWISF